MNLFKNFYTIMNLINTSKQELFSFGYFTLILQHRGWLQAGLYGFSILLLYFFSFMLGALLCGFFQCMLYRKDKGLPLLGSRSFCDHCGKTLKGLDFVSFLNYLLLRGHCRYCRAPLPLKYFYSEIFSGLSMLLLIVSRVFVFYALPFAVFLVFANSYRMYFPKLTVLLVLCLSLFVALYFLLFTIPRLNFLLSLPVMLLTTLIYYRFISKDGDLFSVVFLTVLSALTRPAAVIACSLIMLGLALLVAGEKKQSIQKYLLQKEIRAGALFFSAMILGLCLSFTFFQSPW